MPDRGRQGEHDARRLPSLWPALLDEVWTFLGTTSGLRTNGHNVMLYRGATTEAEMGVEVGVQVTRSFEPTGRVVPSTLPASETATTVHTGPVAEIGNAHDAVRAWCAAHGRALTGVSWEIYGDPDATGHFDVEIHWQLAID